MFVHFPVPSLIVRHFPGWKNTPIQDQALCLTCLQQKKEQHDNMYIHRNLAVFWSRSPTFHEFTRNTAIHQHYTPTIKKNCKLTTWLILGPPSCRADIFILHAENGGVLLVHHGFDQAKVFGKDAADVLLEHRRKGGGWHWPKEKNNCLPAPFFVRNFTFADGLLDL